jgi:hypothetical protein
MLAETDRMLLLIRLSGNCWMKPISGDPFFFRNVKLQEGLHVKCTSKQVGVLLHSLQSLGALHGSFVPKFKYTFFENKSN